MDLNQIRKVVTSQDILNDMGAYIEALSADMFAPGTVSILHNKPIVLLDDAELRDLENYCIHEMQYLEQQKPCEVTMKLIMEISKMMEQIDKRKNTLV